jgi:hypothetical protein
MLKAAGKLPGGLRFSKILADDRHQQEDEPG